MDSKQILDQEFLQIRARILEVGAALDRIERAAGDVSKDNRMTLIRDALRIAASRDPHRAERIQLLFSREYDEAWQDKFGLTSKT